MVWMVRTIAKKYPFLNVVGAYNSFDGNFGAIKRFGTIDLVILDLDISGANGLQLMAFFRSKNCEVIVMSEWATFAFEAIRAGVIDYFLKPVSETDVEKALERVLLAIFEKRFLKSRIRNSIQGSKTETPVNSLVGIENPIAVEDIVCCRSGKECLSIFMITGESYKVNLLLPWLEYGVFSKYFIRVNRFCLVNALYVKKFRESDSLLLMEGGIYCKLGKIFKNKFLDFVHTD